MDLEEKPGAAAAETVCAWLGATGADRRGRALNTEGAGGGRGRQDAERRRRRKRREAMNEREREVEREEEERRRRRSNVKGEKRMTSE